ncbi:hypothetical protein [Sulfitobacter guttiformis]|uniref:Uncharacterized protein n=1 Tax=Sulfitobacter guttiformis TaxID=74349 RepID=A0A420DHR4_9RHOB|nr:hypothetical protein [Sulfitobacter guttiformis]KIN72504.1 hypothetical protein Z949_1679 [Sulfitobacter guttiformis KCTC 32187]RKE93747.1 hypothetical protein C8N30_2841 [Sulfitobacter guttiformis]
MRIQTISNWVFNFARPPELKTGNWTREQWKYNSLVQTDCTDRKVTAIVIILNLQAATQIGGNAFGSKLEQLVGTVLDA